MDKIFLDWLHNYIFCTLKPTEEFIIQYAMIYSFLYVVKLKMTPAIFTSYFFIIIGHRTLQSLTSLLKNCPDDLKKESDILSNFRSKETDLIIYVFHFPVTRLCLLSVRLSVLRGWTFSKVPWLLAEINRVAWLLLVLVLTIPCPYPFHRPLYW